MPPIHLSPSLALRPSGPRAIRRLRRLYTTPPSNRGTPKLLNLRSQLPAHALPLTAPTTHAHPGPIPKPRSLRPYIYATICVLTGCFAGNCVNTLIAPPAPPIPHTARDQLIAADLAAQAAQLPCVQAWSTDAHWIVANLDDEPRGSLINSAFAGTRALGGYQKLFTHTTTGEVVLVIWLGPALAGWPGVTHGGVLATVLDETLRRCVQGSSEPLSRTLQLQVTYLKPVLTNCFYVLRATPSLSTGSTPDAASATLATVSGVVCVEAKGVFDVAAVGAGRQKSS